MSTVKTPPKPPSFGTSTPSVAPDLTPADVSICNHGSLFTLVALTVNAEVWLNKHVEPALRYAGAWCVDASTATSIVDAMQEAGFNLSLYL